MLSFIINVTLCIIVVIKASQCMSTGLYVLALSLLFLYFLTIMSSLRSGDPAEVCKN